MFHFFLHFLSFFFWGQKLKPNDKKNVLRMYSINVYKYMRCIIYKYVCVCVWVQFCMYTVSFKWISCVLHAFYSWASDSCWTNLKRRGEQIELLATSKGFFSAPSKAKCFRIRRDTRICGRCCHSCITSLGVFTYFTTSSLTIRTFEKKFFFQAKIEKNDFTHLVTFQTVQQCNAHDGWTNACMIC